ncbi:MAG TPA: DMT family transporter [bacterium]|nr:DMT family transporter [bacterium]
MGASPLPALLALLGAMFFGISGLAAQQGLRHGDARHGSLISIGTTALFYWLLLPYSLHEAHWTAATLLRFLAVFGAIGLLSPSVSLLLSFEGNRRLGPTVSGTIASTAPLFGAGSAVLVLGERLTPGVGLGTLGIVAGVMVLSWRRAGRRDAPLWAALFPLGAAIVRGGGHMVTKLAFEVAVAPFTAALVTYNVSFVAVALANRFGSARRPRIGLAAELRAILHSGRRWFLLTGVLNGLALLCQFVALSRGQVVVVSPIVSTYPLFTFAFSLLFRLERLGLRIALGVLLVVLGVVAVSTH